MLVLVLAMPPNLTSNYGYGKAASRWREEGRVKEMFFFLYLLLVF